MTVVSSGDREIRPWPMPEIAAMFRVHSMEVGSAKAHGAFLRCRKPKGGGRVGVLHGSSVYLGPTERALREMTTPQQWWYLRTQFNPAIVYGPGLFLDGYYDGMPPARAQALYNYGQVSRFPVVGDVHSKDVEAGKSPTGEAYCLVGELPNPLTLRALAKASSMLKTEGRLIITSTRDLPLLYGYAPGVFGIELSKVRGRYPIDRLKKLFGALALEDEWKTEGHLPNFCCYELGRGVTGREIIAAGLPANGVPDFTKLTDRQCEALGEPPGTAVMDWFGADMGCNVVRPIEQPPEWQNTWNAQQPPLRPFPCQATVETRFYESG